MPAAVYVGDGRIAFEEVPRPEPGPDEVLVEITACGICGSDLHMVLEKYARPGSILGHEWSGIVTTAPGDSGWVPGDRVVGNAAAGCGTCRPCRRGRPSVCLHRPSADFAGYRGAFCQFKTVAANGLIRIPDALATRPAALAEPTAITLHALRLANVRPEDRVLVTGAGPVGLLIIAVLKAQGINDITVSEPSAVRRQQALDVGAARVVSPDALEAPPMTLPVAEPFAGRVRMLRSCQCGRGRLRTARLRRHPGHCGDRVRPAPLQSEPHDHLRARGHRGLQLRRRGLRPAVDLLGSGTLPLDTLIEPEDIPLTEVMDAMERLARGEIPSKVMVGPGLSA